MEGILVQIVLTDGTRRLHDQAVRQTQCIHTHQTYDFLELRFLLQKAHGFASQVIPVVLGCLAERLGQAVGVQRITVQPVDGREMSSVGQRGIQSPEHLDDSKRTLGYRLGDVSTRRGNRPDGRDGCFPLIRTQAEHASRTLIELRQTRRQIGWIAFLTGHLLKTSGHLAQRFRPAGGRVCHDGHGVSHVAEVLCNGDAGIDGGLTRRHRHIGGVGDQHGPLHQGLSRFGILEFRELHQNIGHLVATLTTAHVDNDVCIRPLGQLVLHDRLAGSEGTRNRSGSTLGHRKEGVDDPLSGHHRDLRRQLGLVFSTHTHRGLLTHDDVF